MLSLLVNTRSPGKIDNLTLDATISDKVSIRNEVTSLPIEDGSDVNDHIIKKPLSLTIVGVVSNTPLASAIGLTAYTESFKSSAAGQLIKDTGTRVDSALDELLRIAGRTSGELIDSSDVPIVTVVTGLKVYSNLVLTMLNIERDRNTGDALPFTAEFTNIHKAKLNYVTIQPPVKDESNATTQTAKVSKVGRVEKKVTQPKVSILAGLFNKLASGK